MSSYPTPLPRFRTSIPSLAGYDVVVEEVIVPEAPKTVRTPPMPRPSDQCETRPMPRPAIEPPARLPALSVAKGLESVRPVAMELAPAPAVSARRERAVGFAAGVAVSLLSVALVVSAGAAKRALDRASATSGPPALTALAPIELPAVAVEDEPFVGPPMAEPVAEAPAVVAPATKPAPVVKKPPRSRWRR